VIVKLPKSKCTKDIRSLLGHARFYRRFTKEFSRTARPLTNLLAKDMSFKFDERRLDAKEKLKKELVSTLIISAPDWIKPFKIMCDASSFAIGIVLGQHIDNKQHIIYYSSKNLNDVQLNCTMTEKEFLVVVFALEKFRLYLLGQK